MSDKVFTRNSRRKFLSLERFEARQLLAADLTPADSFWVTIDSDETTDAGNAGGFWAPANPSSSLGSPLVPVANDTLGGNPILTVVVDFKAPDDPNTTDRGGGTVTTFDVTDFGFAPEQFDDVVDQIMEEVNEDFFFELTDTAPLPRGEDLAIEFVLGEVGVPPVNANEYYFIQVGSGTNVPFGRYGQAVPSSIRTANGGDGSQAIGATVGSIFTNNIAALNVQPSNALSSGNMDFVVNAIAGTLSHEIGHALSLDHVYVGNSVQPTPGVLPLMATASSGLTPQQRLVDREFSLSAQVSEGPPQTQMDVQQMRTILGRHPDWRFYGTEGVDDVVIDAVQTGTGVSVSLSVFSGGTEVYSWVSPGNTSVESFMFDANEGNDSIDFTNTDIHALVNGGDGDDLIELDGFGNAADTLIVGGDDNDFVTRNGADGLVVFQPVVPNAVGQLRDGNSRGFEFDDSVEQVNFRGFQSNPVIVERETNDAPTNFAILEEPGADISVYIHGLPENETVFMTPAIPGGLGFVTVAGDPQNIFFDDNIHDVTFASGGGADFFQVGVGNTNEFTILGSTSGTSFVNLQGTSNTETVNMFPATTSGLGEVTVSNNASLNFGFLVTQVAFDTGGGNDSVRPRPSQTTTFAMTNNLGIGVPSLWTWGTEGDDLISLYAAPTGGAFGYIAMSGYRNIYFSPQIQSVTLFALGGNDNVFAYTDDDQPFYHINGGDGFDTLTRFGDGSAIGFEFEWEG